MNHEPVWARHHAERNGLAIEVYKRPAVKLALVQNRVPPVTSVTVRNVDDHPQVDTTVSVSQHGRGRELAEPWFLTREGKLEPGKKHSCSDLGTIHPAHDHLAGLNQSHPATPGVVASRRWGEKAKGTRTSSLGHETVRRSRSRETGSRTIGTLALDWIS